MMFERFTDEARAVVALASEHARRLGHRYIGGEHLLLAAVTAGQPASAVLAAHGVTPELVEEEIVRRVGLGAGAGLFGGLDKDALATIGIDPPPGPRPPALVRHWLRRRRPRRAMTTVPAPGPRPPEATGRYCAPGPRPSGHIPFTPASKKVLELSLREAVALSDPNIGVEHIALALTTIKQGLVPPILAEAGTTAAALRTAILDRYRRAS
jgi:hypothetical protein